MSLSTLTGGGAGPPGPTGATGAVGATGAAGPANLKVAMLAADFTNATTTMAAITAGGKALSVPVLSGRRYAFEAVLMANDSSTDAVDGARIDFDASTAAMSNFRSYADDGVAATFSASVNGFTTALPTDHEGAWGGAGPNAVIVRGTLEPSSSGDFAMRAAQRTHSDGTLTIYRGSYLAVLETTE